MLIIIAVIVTSIVGATGPMDSIPPGNTAPAHIEVSKNGSPPLTFFTGRYQAVGRHPDTQKSYLADITISLETDRLKMVRKIGDESTICRGQFEEATGDRIPVLRFTFEVNGIEYGSTYLWQSDLDNYARLTGHIYRVDGKTRIPGLEALFIKH
jgi:hypothetical protein